MDKKRSPIARKHISFVDRGDQAACPFEGFLPSLFDDWWNQTVVSNLSFQQRRRIEQRNIKSMALLDLAALKVFIPGVRPR